MSLETVVQDFTDKTEELLTAVNLRKVELDAAKDAAADSAEGAFNSAATATFKAAEATSSATNAANSSASAGLSRDAAATSATQAGASAVAAAASAVAASDFEVGAGENAAAAAASATAAATARSGSEAARDASVTAKTASEAARDAAQVAKAAAETAETNAEMAEAAAETAQALAEAARSAAQTSAGEASASKDAAALSATAAASSASEADADRIAAQTARAGSETARDAAQAAQTAAETARTGAQTAQAGAQTARTGAETAQTGAQTARAGAEAAQVAAASSLASSISQTQTATAQASLAAGYAASAASVVQQDLSGVNVQALHRSPNAITALHIYDTSKDSDGGAWTEKCQHTSWWNEPLMGKWLGAQDSEAFARYQGATLGPELVTNGNFSNGTTGWSLLSGVPTTYDVVNGRVRLIGTNSYIGVTQQITGLVVGKTYIVSVEYEKSNFDAAQIWVGGTAGGLQWTNAITFGGAPSGRIQAVFVAQATTGWINFRGNSVSGTGTVYFDNASFREVTALNATSRDYFQLTADGKFYRLLKNIFAQSDNPLSGHWVAGGNAASYVATTETTAPDGSSTVYKLIPNAGSGSPGQAATSGMQMVAGVPYSFAVVAKAGQYPRIGLRMYDGSSYLFHGTIDLTTGNAVSNVGTVNVTATPHPLGGGWYIVKAENFISKSGNVGITIEAHDAASTAQQNFTADGTSGIYIWRAQIEAGSVSTEATAHETNASTDMSVARVETFRGNKADFPRLAGIVGEGSNVTIYDLTEPGRPMWATYRALRDYTSATARDAWAIQPNVSSISGMNGLICIGNNGSNQSPSYGTGLWQFNYPRDIIQQVTAFGYAQRRLDSIPHFNSSVQMKTAEIGVLSNVTINGIAMTTLADAPIDPATGLRVPTIALATGNGAAVIKHDGNVVINNGTSELKSISVNKDLLIGASYNGALYATNPGSLPASFALLSNSLSINSAPDYYRAAWHVSLKLTGKTKLLSGSMYSPLVAAAVLHPTSKARSISSIITNTHNTGWLPGDIRRAYLSDADAAAVSGTELITNGSFDVDASGWSSLSGATVSSGTLNFATSSGAYWIIQQTIPTRIGATYRVSFDIVSLAGNAGTPYVGVGWKPAQEIRSFAAAGKAVGYWVAKEATATICFYFINCTVSLDNVSVTEVVSDRSYKAQFASVNGSVTRSTLATGTSLVGYSGFSAANYLREPYSADLDFGTGEWTANAWVNVPATLPASSFPNVGAELVTNGDFSSGTTGWSLYQVSGTATFTESGGVATLTNPAGSAYATAYQAFATVVGRTYRATGQLVSASGSTFNAIRKSDEATGGTNTINIYGGSGVSTPGTGTVYFTATATTTYILAQVNNANTASFDNISVREVGPSVLCERAHSSGARIRLSVNGFGQLIAEAFDGATTRAVTTPSAYNTAQWLKAEACYTTDGTLSIRVNGREVATTRGTPLLSLNSRYNLLTQSQNFADSSWAVISGFSSKVSTSVSDPIGGTTACEIAYLAANGSLSKQSISASMVSGSQYTFSIWARRDSGSNQLTFGTNTGTVLGNLTPTSTWQRYSVTFTYNGSWVHIMLGDPNASGWTNVQFWGAQLDIGATAKTYQRVGAATDFDFAAPLTIGNNFAADAPFPGSISLLKLGATVPTYEQSQFMYEQEKQMFRPGAQSVLPDSGSIVDMAYDDATDRWVAISATNESYWTGLVRNNVTPVPAGSYTRIVAGSGVELAARSTTNPGVDVTIPAYGLREELVKRAEAAARLSRELLVFDYVGGFTANTTSGSTAITNVSTITYPASYIGARISGAGIPANTTIVAVSGTTLYLSAAATATASAVAISFLDFQLPLGLETKAVLAANAPKQEGTTKDFTRLYDGFIETVRFAVAPGATAWVQIQAQRMTS